MDYTRGKWKAHKSPVGDWIIQTEESLVCREVRHYNANLISSAPDMYEAIRLYHKHQVGKRGHFCAECWAKLEDALAKAEGK